MPQCLARLRTGGFALLLGLAEATAGAEVLDVSSSETDADEGGGGDDGDATIEGAAGGVAAGDCAAKADPMAG